MYRFNQFLFVAVFSLIFVSCKKDPPEIPWPSGKADFSRYIAVGNSLTAGYSNGGLYLQAQQSAYPLIIAGQMKTVGGGNFYTPFFPANQANGSGYLKLLGFGAEGSPIIVRENSSLAVRGQATIPGFGNVTLLTKYTGEINNYGVPGIRLDQITYAPLGNLNSYYERILPLDAGENVTPYIDFVTAKPFTFFSCWLGNNDVLGYATSGGGEALTDKANFAALYSLAINRLTATNAKGIVATIPDVTSIPYLTTVTIPKLLAGVKKVNPAVNALFISALDPATGTYAARPATESDYVVLEFNTANLGGTVNGLPFYGLTPANPLRNNEILDKAEAAKAKEYVEAYNSSIKSVAASKGLAIFDSYEFLNKLKAGMIINGIAINSDFITGGAFSLDGIHLTPRGNAMTANEYIKAINSTYHSTIPQVDISKYAAVLP
jgi:phospholipase/lecithinase/hemolysin